MLMMKILKIPLRVLEDIFGILAGYWAWRISTDPLPDIIPV